MGLSHSSRDGGCLAQHLLELIWAPPASPDMLNCIGQACTRLDAKFKAIVKNKNRWEETSPANSWRLILFEEPLQFRWLVGQ